MPLSYNSTILKKKMNLACGHFDYPFSKGRCKACAALDRKPIKRMSDKRMSQINEEFGTEQALRTGQHGAALERWFKERHSEMTGICMHCGGKSSKDTPMYKCSIAHILPKAHFPSIATHPLNWVELCFWGKSCHTNYDNLMLDITELHCFDTVIERFIAMYPQIADKEKRRIPAALMTYIEIP